MVLPFKVGFIHHSFFQRRHQPFKVGFIKESAFQLKRYKNTYTKISFKQETNLSKYALYNTLTVNVGTSLSKSAHISSLTLEIDFSLGPQISRSWYDFSMELSFH